MIVRPTNDAAEIRKILCDSSIYSAISEDGNPAACDFEPPIDACYNYIACYVGNNIIGLMVYHAYDDGNKCHLMVLPEFRSKYAKRFLKESLHYNSDLPLYVEIPEINKNVIFFALANGFKRLRVNEKAFLKNGKIYDTNILIYNSEV